MVEVIGDVVIPSELICPTSNTVANQPAKTGALFISGAKLCFYTGSAVEVITSA